MRSKTQLFSHSKLNFLSLPGFIMELCPMHNYCAVINWIRHTTVIFHFIYYYKSAANIISTMHRDEWRMVERKLLLIPQQAAEHIVMQKKLLCMPKKILHTHTSIIQQFFSAFEKFKFYVLNIFCVTCVRMNNFRAVN